VETTEPMSIDQAVEAMVAPETPEEETELETEDAQPEEDVSDEVEEDVEDDGEEVESESDDDDEDEDVDDEVDDEEDDQEPQESYTVKVDGEEFEVDLEELKRGYSGQKYVHKGMQQVAEDRKQVESVHAALMQERQNLMALMNQVQAGNLTPPKEPTRELFDSDPYGYMEAKMNYDEQIKVYQQNVAQVQQQLTQQSQAERQARAAYAQQEARKLVESVPEIADPSKAEAFLGKVHKTAERFGYTKEEIQGIVSSRDIMVLDAAGKWWDMQEGKKVVQEKSKKARKPVKAGAKKINRKSDAVRKQRDKLRQSGSIDDALSLILNPNLK
jgi:hypothetical protein